MSEVLVHRKRDLQAISSFYFFVCWDQMRPTTPHTETNENKSQRLFASQRADQQNRESNHQSYTEQKKGKLATKQAQNIRTGIWPHSTLSQTRYKPHRTKKRNWPPNMHKSKTLEPRHQAHPHQEAKRIQPPATHRTKERETCHQAHRSTKQGI